jgi:hypothetical protein
VQEKQSADAVYSTQYAKTEAQIILGTVKKQSTKYIGITTADISGL